MEDENQMLQPTSDKYDGQQKVFDDVGQGVLKNAYDGFNTSLFAYGQTGAGKSFSMVGYGNNKGIVPLAFDALFKKIDGDPSKLKLRCSLESTVTTPPPPGPRLC